MRVIFLVSPVDKQVVWTVNWIWCSEIQHGKASCYIATDEEDRSANRDALQPGAKRGRPIVIAVRIFFYWTRFWLHHWPAGAVISLVAPRLYQPIAIPREDCPIENEKSIHQSNFCVATTAVTAANRVLRKRSLRLNSLLFVYCFAARARGEAAVSVNVSIKPSYFA